MLVALGGIIGAGFFLGSGVPLHHAGRGAILVYLFGGFLMYLEVSLLAEMASTHPVAGGFSTYAQEYYGPWIGFVSGWMYWTSGVLVMSSEVTAAAVFVQRWLPHWPLSVFALVFSAVMVLVNVQDAAGFAAAEGVLSALKVVALVFFVLLVAGTLAGAPLRGVWRGGPFLPEGLPGLGGSLLFAMFAYTGTSVIALAAAETKEPARTIPRAIHLVTLVVLLLYLSSIGLVTLVVSPKHASTTVSPFVQALDSLRRPWVGSLMNVAILVAALSSMNSALYGVTRMLFALGERGNAPARLTRLSRRGVPAAALGVSSLALGVTIVLAHLLPRTAYVLVSGATSLVSMFNWGLIALTHLRHRAASEQSRSARLDIANKSPSFRMWGYPWTSYLALGLVILVTGTAWFLPAQRIGLVGLMALFALFSGVYFVTHRRVAP